MVSLLLPPSSLSLSGISSLHLIKKSCWHLTHNFSLFSFLTTPSWHPPPLSLSPLSPRPPYPSNLFIHALPIIRYMHPFVSYWFSFPLFCVRCTFFLLISASLSLSLSIMCPLTYASAFSSIHLIDSWLPYWEKLFQLCFASIVWRTVFAAKTVFWRGRLYRVQK